LEVVALILWLVVYLLCWIYDGILDVVYVCCFATVGSGGRFSIQGCDESDWEERQEEILQGLKQ
jgi:hypothetical protein